MRGTKFWLIFILLAALLGRIGWGIIQPIDRQSIDRLPDQAEYLALGENLLHGKGLSFYDDRFQQEVYAYRTPGYPALIAACGSNIRLLRLVQALLDTSTVLAIYWLAQQWLDKRASLIAAFFVAVNPFLIYFSGLILSETLFTALLAWGMALLIRGKRPWPGALLLVLSILVRPSALPLALLLGWAGAVAVQDFKSMRWIGIKIFILTGLVLLPWGFRNKSVLNTWIFTTTNAGITLYDGFNPEADGSSNQSFIGQMSKPFLTALGEVGRDRYFADEARHYRQRHPMQCLTLAVRKIARTWSPMPLSADFHKPVYILAGLIYSIPLDVLVVLGLVRSPLPRAAKTFLLMPALYITVVHGLSVGSLRYRIPVEAPMAIVAAAGVKRNVKRET